MRLIEALSEFANSGRLFENESMAKHTSFRIGGPAEVMFFPQSLDEMRRAMDICKNERVKLTVIGNGSNLLVSDGGVRGLVLALGAPFSDVLIDGCTVRACAGVSLAALSRRAQAEGLAGLEFASGIPGSLGGGVCMNAGAYGGQMADVVTQARMLARADADAFTLDAAGLAFSYRHSAPLASGDIVTQVVLTLTPDDPRAIQARMDDLNARRREKQPQMPSAGSVFKRPEGHFAGQLIEQAGFKGVRVGGAVVSEMHAGFIVNTGGATARDVLELIHKITSAVLHKFGVSLETEIRMLGAEDEGAQ